MVGGQATHRRLGAVYRLPPTLGAAFCVFLVAFMFDLTLVSLATGFFTVDFLVSLAARTACSRWALRTCAGGGG